MTKNKDELNKLFEENIGIIYKVLKNKRIFIPKMEQDDLFQIGSIGLINAIQTYDENNGIAFSTYAYSCVSNYIYKEIKRNRAYKRDDDFHNTFSINLYDKKYDEGNCIELQDTLQSNDNNLENIEIKIDIEKVIKKLKEEEKYIINQIFFKDRTEIDLAKELKISRQALNKKKKKILEKLKKEFENYE